MENFIMIFLFFLSLSILIILHECGHFFPAIWFKTRVEKFYLFFNPYFSLFKKKIGDTEYGLGWLPLGGYVKIAGMIDESFDKEQLKNEPQPWEFRSKPAWQRLIIMLGGVTVNFLLGFFIFSMLLWKNGSEYLPTKEMKYGVGVDSISTLYGFKDGDIITKVGNVELEQFDKRKIIKTILLQNARTVEVIRDGQITQIPIAQEFVDFLVKPESKNYNFWTIRIPIEVDTVVKGAPAEKAGLKAGDKIFSFNNTPVSFIHEFILKMKDQQNQSIQLGILRGTDTINLNVNVDEKGKIGLGWEPIDKFMKTEKKTYSLLQALPAGTMQGVNLLKDYCRSIGQMFTGNIKTKDSLGGFISITKQFPNTWNWTAFWGITAMLSIILAFMNLLPIPALDGGYVMFLIFEVITGKKVSDSFIEKATMIGFFLLIGLLVYANGLDILRLFK